MLNRRLLRIKVMQSIYAFQQNRESHFQMAIDQIKAAFNEEFMEFGHEAKERLAKEEKLTIEYFLHNYQHRTAVVTSPELDEKMLRLGAAAVNYYHNQLAADYEDFRRRMVFETEHLYFRYLKFLSYLIDMAELTEQELTAKTLRESRYLQSEKDLHELLVDNKAMQLLRAHKALEKELSEQKVRTGADLEQVKDWLRALKKDEAFMAMRKAERTLEDDREILRYLVKDFLLGNEVISQFFDEQDLNWLENKSILKSMLSKTLKGLGEEEQEVELLSISRDWADDKRFFEELYRLTLQKEEEFESFIEQHSKKWAKERIARIDHILIHMALAEMMGFPNIPVKVTINEFIEISKLYSTPKSWQFINGVLDAISEQLVAEGKILKSGRGLLDNK